MSNNSIERVEAQIKNEIYVDAVTGKGFCSINGTARLAGVQPSSIHRALTSVAQKPSKLAQHLVSKGFKAIALKKFTTQGIPDIAVGEIIKYYAFYAGRYKTQQALLACEAFMAIGVRAYFQDLKGWEKPAEQEISLGLQLKMQIPENPNDWRCRYHQDFWLALKSCYGLEQGQIACSSIINTYVYGYFPEEVQQRLKEINPIQESGYRKNRIHQHFNGEILEVLEAHIQTVKVNLLKAKSIDEFQSFMKRVSKYKFSRSAIKALAEYKG